MQVMPGTWLELSVRYGLGLDPFDPNDNIPAGAAYLKEMHDRFGSTGFLAAYHAGPLRYEQHERDVFGASGVVSWRQAPLFVERVGAR